MFIHNYALRHLYSILNIENAPNECPRGIRENQTYCVLSQEGLPRMWHVWSQESLPQTSTRNIELQILSGFFSLKNVMEWCYAKANYSKCEM